MTSVWTELPRPRELAGAERDLLETLVGHASCPALVEQARSAMVTGTCSCGCSSLRLRCDGPAVPEETIARLSSTGRQDHLGIHASAGIRAGRSVQVAAHVANGMLIELEIYAGEGVAAGTPPPAGLHGVEII